MIGRWDRVSSGNRDRRCLSGDLGLSSHQRLGLRIVSGSGSASLLPPPDFLLALAPGVQRQAGSGQLGKGQGCSRDFLLLQATTSLSRRRGRMWRNYAPPLPSPSPCPSIRSAGVAWTSTSRPGGLAMPRAVSSACCGQGKLRLMPTLLNILQVLEAKARGPGGRVIARKIGSECREMSFCLLLRHPGAVGDQLGLLHRQPGGGSPSTFPRICCCRESLAAGTAAAAPRALLLLVRPPTLAAAAAVEEQRELTDSMFHPEMNRRRQKRFNKGLPPHPRDLFWISSRHPMSCAEASVIYEVSLRSPPFSGPQRTALPPTLNPKP